MQLTQAAFFARSKIWGDAVANRPGQGDTGWKLACIASIFPLAAIFHHAVFWPTTCMLNPFGHDYTPDVLALWLSKDPSLPLAVLAALTGYRLGNKFCSLRVLLVPFLVAFAPLTLWIWDIPFTGRIICSLWHDNHVMLAEGVPLRARHFYFLGAAMYGALMTRGLLAGFADRRLQPAAGTAN